MYAWLILPYFFFFVEGATAYKGAYFGKGAEQSPIFIHLLRCTGYESSLLQCFWRAYQHNYVCHHSNDAGVKCEGILILHNYSHLYMAYDQAGNHPSYQHDNILAFYCKLTVRIC